jgi:hypothetical protein
MSDSDETICDTVEEEDELLSQSGSPSILGELHITTDSFENATKQKQEAALTTPR